MQLTSYPLEFSINDAPTLILDPDPIDENTQFVPVLNQNLTPNSQSDNSSPKLDSDSVRSRYYSSGQNA